MASAPRKPQKILGDARPLPKFDATGPKWNLVIPFGERYRGDLKDGKVVVDRAFAEKIVANFKKFAARYKGDDKYAIPMTYFHAEGQDNSLPIENRVAAGKIIDLRVGAEGVEALEEPTQRAREMIDHGELWCQSPEFADNWEDSFTGESQGPTLFSVSLLNEPFFKDMPHIAAADGGHTMAAKSFKEQLCSELGLHPEASDDSVISEVKKHKASHDQLMKGENHEDVDQSEKKGDDGVSDMADGETTTPDGDGGETGKDGKAMPQNDKTNAAERKARKTLEDQRVKAADKRADDLAKRVAALEKEKKDEQVNGLLDELLDDGKIEAADRETIGESIRTLGVDQVRKHYKNLPPIVDMSERGHGRRGPDDDGDKAPGPKGANLVKAQDTLDKKISELRTADPKLHFHEAHKLAMRACPKEAELLYSIEANGRRIRGEA